MLFIAVGFPPVPFDYAVDFPDSVCTFYYRNEVESARVRTHKFGLQTCVQTTSALHDFFVGVRH